MIVGDGEASTLHMEYVFKFNFSSVTNQLKIILNLILLNNTGI